MPEEKKLIVPPFNKKDIEEIVKELTKNTFESYPNADGILEIDGSTHDLTPEILAFILHCFEVGKINVDNGFLLNLNGATFSDGKLVALCFGCVVTIDGGDVTQHIEDYGAHAEIIIDYDTEKYSFYLTAF